jgi:hypothetical protein
VTNRGVLTCGSNSKVFDFPVDIVICYRLDTPQHPTMARKSKPKTPAALATEDAPQRYGVQSTTDNTGPQLLKDEEEEELEKLLFGDLDGFRAGLRAHEQDEESDREEVRDDGIHGSHDAEKTKDLEALHDDQVSEALL